METLINNKLIRTFSPCYDPSKVTESEEESLPIIEWIEKYRNKINSQIDIIWLICRKEFMSDRDMRLFAVWCARETCQYCTEEYPIDERSINAVDCAERFANGEATEEELSAARSAAESAARSAVWSAAEPAARSAVWSAAWSAAESAARSAVWSAAWSAARSAVWSAVWSAARSAAESAARSAAWSAAELAARSAAWSAAESAARSAAESAQIDQLLTYLKCPNNENIT